MLDTFMIANRFDRLPGGSVAAQQNHPLSERRKRYSIAENIHV
ncbi:MAG: hypothetical protein WBM09_11100 [Gallionella sp.]